MRLIIQRVGSARVRVGKKVVGEIGPGLLILVGITGGDTQEAAELLAEKVLKMRVLADGAGKMNLSLEDKKQEVLVVSQFTLYADTSKGNRPSFIKAADPASAEKLYDHFVKCFEKSGITAKTGSFGDYMEISANLDGPVTIMLEK